MAYEDRVAFLFVYIQEAHADDEWQLDSNRRDSVVFAQPTSFLSRREVATRCSRKLKLTMPYLVDDMQNTVDNAYAGWPERLFVVDKDGRIAYAGKQGPWGFKPEHVSDWLSKNVGPAK